MISRDTNDLILRIYDTVTDPDGWDTVLDRVAGAVGAKDCNVFQGDAVQQELESVWLSGGLTDIFRKPAYTPALAEEAKTYPAIQEIVTESRLIASRDIQAEYHRRGYPPVDMSRIEAILARDYGIRSRYTAPLNRLPHHYEFFTVHYAQDYDEPGFPAERVALGDLLLPHLAKAMAINRPFVLLKRRFRAVLEVLDRFRLGVFILGEDLSVWLENESARQILDNRDAFQLKPDGRLGGVTAQARSALQGAVTRLAGEGETAPARSVRLRFGDPARREPYVADFSVLRSDDLGTLQAKRGILMVVVDPERTAIVNGDSVAELFGFTQAEAAVFSLVVRGHTNREVADQRNVNPETVATQMKSLLQKTGCRRRGDLVHLAHSVNIPVDTGGR